MMIRRLLLLTLCIMLVATAQAENETIGLQTQPPRGYYAQLDLLHQGRRLSFGPFVGYYFKPKNGDDLTRLEFVCYNARTFYTDERAENALLFRGEAILDTLDANTPIPAREQRITPVFFADAPAAWRENRPSPQDAFLHFHSAYNGQGAVHTGYWLRHEAVAPFAYNMGGRIARDSPLYHLAEPGHAERFPRIVEFDFGP